MQTAYVAVPVVGESRFARVVPGTALWHEGAVCHLAAFPVEDPETTSSLYDELAG